MTVPVHWQSFARFPPPYSAFATLQIRGDLLPRLERFALRIAV
jgi:hypothetical protein